MPHGGMVSGHRLLSYDPQTLTRQWFKDNEDGSFDIVTEQEMDPVLANNQELRKDGDVHKRWGEGQLVASIPMSVWWDLWQKGIVQDEPVFKRWLNDSTNLVFRRRLGVV